MIANMPWNKANDSPGMESPAQVSGRLFSNAYWKGWPITAIAWPVIAAFEASRQVLGDDRATNGASQREDDWLGLRR